VGRLVNLAISKPDMRLISRTLFEHHLSAHLDRIEPGLAALLRHKVGYAWRPMVDEMYQQRADSLTFANLTQVLTECARSLARLNDSLEGE
jgi:hypothetical protein